MDDTTDHTHKSAIMQPSPVVESSMQQRHATCWQYSSVSGTTIWNHSIPSTYPSSPQQPAETQPHFSSQQFYRLNLNVMESFNHSHQASSVISFGFDEQCHNPTAHHPQSHTAEQHSPLAYSTVQFPLTLHDYIDHYYEQRREANNKLNQEMQQFIQRQQDHLRQTMNLMDQIMSFFQRLKQPETITVSAASDIQQQAEPSIHMSNEIPAVIDSIGSPINQQHQSIDQLINPASIVKQQQYHGPSKTIAHSTFVSTTHETNAIGCDHKKNVQSAEVFNPSNDDSPQEEQNKSNQCHPINFTTTPTRCVISSGISFRLKFITHFLDRNGHPMNSASGNTPVFSDVFVWMVNQVQRRSVICH